MKFVLLTILTVCVPAMAWADASAVGSATTQPTATLGELQLRANEDMAKGDYTAALPLLLKVQDLLIDQPDQVGPVAEQIRVCQRQLAAAPAAKPTPLPSVVSVVDGDVRKVHAPVPAGQTLAIPIKELGNFDYDAEIGGNIPDDVKGLDGCHIRTSGYMIPLDQAESISEFALVPSLFACCFGQPPQIQHTIVVTCPKGKAVSYFPDELTVEGTLHVSEQKDGGFIVSIFQIDATSVRPAAK